MFVAPIRFARSIFSVHVLQDSTAYQRESLLYAEGLGQVCIYEVNESDVCCIEAMFNKLLGGGGHWKPYRRLLFKH